LPHPPTPEIGVDIGEEFWNPKNTKPSAKSDNTDRGRVNSMSFLLPVLSLKYMPAPVREEAKLVVLVINDTKLTLRSYINVKEIPLLVCS